jgi:hypothetical protein
MVLVNPRLPDAASSISESVMIKVSESVDEPADLRDDQVDGFGPDLGHGSTPWRLNRFLTR